MRWRRWRKTKRKRSQTPTTNHARSRPSPPRQAWLLPGRPGFFSPPSLFLLFWPLFKAPAGPGRYFLITAVACFSLGDVTVTRRTHGADPSAAPWPFPGKPRRREGGGSLCSCSCLRALDPPLQAALTLTWLYCDSPLCGWAVRAPSSDTRGLRKGQEVRPGEDCLGVLS